MRTVITLAALLLLVGCATSPEAEQQRLQQQASIAEILSQPLDPAEYGEVKRCLSDMDFRSFEALDDRHILFLEPDKSARGVEAPVASA